MKICAAVVLMAALYSEGVLGGDAGSPPARGTPLSDAFKFGRSEADLVKSLPGLVCAVAQSNLWGQADRSCFMSGQVAPRVDGTIVFNLRNDRFVSAVLVIDQVNVDAFLQELMKRHGKPSAALPSAAEPQKAVWLYENRVLIFERSLAEIPDMSSLLVSADQPIIERARALVTELGGDLPPRKNLSEQ